MEIQKVDPQRLQSGQWCHRAQKTIGQGDISASYSADRIGMGQPVRKPFGWQGRLYVCTSVSWLKGVPSAESYRLLSVAVFNGTPVTYRDRVMGGDEARNDPNGFYHGMTVKHAGQVFVLAGPPVTFVEGVRAQLDLFG